MRCASCSADCSGIDGGHRTPTTVCSRNRTLSNRWWLASELVSRCVSMLGNTHQTISTHFTHRAELCQRLESHRSRCRPMYVHTLHLPAHHLEHTRSAPSIHLVCVYLVLLKARKPFLELSPSHLLMFFVLDDRCRCRTCGMPCLRSLLTRARSQGRRYPSRSGIRCVSGFGTGSECGSGTVVSAGANAPGLRPWGSRTNGEGLAFMMFLERTSAAGWESSGGFKGRDGVAEKAVGSGCDWRIPVGQQQWKRWVVCLLLPNRER